MSYRRITSIRAIFLALAMTTAVFGQSQANTGTIEGVVNDPSSRPVPNADVVLTNTGTNFTRAIKTDNEGRFRGLLLPLGFYKITASAANFGKQIREGLDLEVGQ